MPPKINPLKLNKLQLRTLALAQVLANDPNTGVRDEASGEVSLMSRDRAYFILRKAHSLTGIIPVGTFLLAHLFLNSSALLGE